MLICSQIWRSWKSVQIISLLGINTSWLRQPYIILFVVILKAKYSKLHSIIFSQVLILALVSNLLSAFWIWVFKIIRDRYQHWWVLLTVRSQAYWTRHHFLNYCPKCAVHHSLCWSSPPGYQLWTFGQRSKCQSDSLISECFDVYVIKNQLNT